MSARAGYDVGLVNPHQMYVDLSDKLFKIKSDLLEQMSMEQLK